MGRFCEISQDLPIFGNICQDWASIGSNNKVRALKESWLRLEIPDTKIGETKDLQVGCLLICDA